MYRKLFGSVAVAALVTFGACDSGQVTPPTTVGFSPSEVQSALVNGAVAGRLHNDFMRLTLSGFAKERGRSGLLRPSDLRRLAMESCRQWVRENDGLPNACGHLQAILGGSSPVPMMQTASSTSGPSATYVALLGDLETAVGPADDAADYLSETAALWSQAVLTLTDTLELAAFAAARSVADSSAVYWEDEVSEWLTMGMPDCEGFPELEDHPNCVTPEAPPIASGSWPSGMASSSWPSGWALCKVCARIIAGDAGGAAGAAVYSWWMGVGAAGPVGIVGGAASVGAAVTEIILWAIPE